MNRLTRLMVEAYENARMFRVSHVNDTRSHQAFKYWKQEYETYQAICQCIRRGYKPMEEEWHDCDDCANYELIIHPSTLGAMGNHCQFWRNMTDDETRLLLLGRCPYWMEVRKE